MKIKKSEMSDGENLPTPAAKIQEAKRPEFMLTKKDKRLAKLAKLRRNPRMFFADVHAPMFRPLRHLFKR